MLPAWLVSKPAIYAGAIGAGLIAVLLWFKAHDARVKREAFIEQKISATEAEIARQDSVLQIMQDSLHDAQQNTDTVRIYTQAAAASYREQRGRINIDAPQPIGTPAGMVNVPIAFVRTADSLAVLVPTLIATIAAERVAAERRIAASDSLRMLMETEITQLKIAIEASKPKLSDKLKYAAIGGAVIYAGTQLLGRK